MDFYEEIDPNTHDKIIGFCSGSDGWQSKEKLGEEPVYKAFGNFIIQSLSSDSAISKYFHDLKIKILDNRFDRVYMSLALMLDIKEGKTDGLDIERYHQVTSD